MPHQVLPATLLRCSASSCLGPLLTRWQGTNYSHFPCDTLAYFSNRISLWHGTDFFYFLFLNSSPSTDPTLSLNSQQHPVRNQSHSRDWRFNSLLQRWGDSLQQHLIIVGVEADEEGNKSSTLDSYSLEWSFWCDLAQRIKVLEAVSAPINFLNDTPSPIRWAESKRRWWEASLNILFPRTWHCSPRYTCGMHNSTVWSVYTIGTRECAQQKAAHLTSELPFCRTKMRRIHIIQPLHRRLFRPPVVTESGIRLYSVCRLIYFWAICSI